MHVYNIHIHIITYIYIYIIHIYNSVCVYMYVRYVGMLHNLHSSTCCIMLLYCIIIANQSDDSDGSSYVQHLQARDCAVCCQPSVDVTGGLSLDDEVTVQHVFQ